MSIAVFGPDFIDKPLHLLFRLPVHGVGHSLLFFTAVILIAWFSRTWLKFNSQTSVAGIVMWGTHLVGDFLKPQVLFWPFEGQWIASSKFHNIEGLWEFYVDRLFFAQFWLEIACVMILATLLLSKLFVPLSPPPEIIQVSEVPASDRNL